MSRSPGRLDLIRRDCLRQTDLLTRTPVPIIVLPSQAGCPQAPGDPEGAIRG
jgi:hypothetical protein